MKRLTLMLFLGLNFCTALAGARVFVPGSLGEIKKAHQGQPFVLMMWSLDCRACVQELDLLAAQLRRYPEMRLVMVSSDEIAYRPRVEELLARHGLGGVESWIFADGETRRLRHEIDPSWYGELPRSYFYDAAHERVPLSGAITEEHVETWLKAVKR